MKKIFAIAAIALLSMVSCSDDDNNEGQPVANETILLKKTVTSTTNTQQGVRVARYYYDGNKLSRIAYSNGNSEVITYEGDYIVQWDKFTADALTEHNVYTYNDSGLLAVMTKQTNKNVTVTYHYTHYAEQIISYTKESTSTSVVENGTYHYSKLILPDGTGGTYGDVNAVDDKNNPLKNIAGLYRIYFTFTGNRINLLNNVTAVHNIKNDLYLNTRSRTTYVYDENNFPVASERTEGFTTTTQYFYE